MIAAFPALGELPFTEAEVRVVALALAKTRAARHGVFLIDNTTNQESLEVLTEARQRELFDDAEAVLTARAAAGGDELMRLRQWVADLQSGMYVNCVYCGHRYGPGETTPVSMAEALKQHVEQCPAHPMSALKAENERLRDDLRRAALQCGNVIYNTRQMPADNDRHLASWESVQAFLKTAARS
jgi:hypothetical protein